MVSVLGVCNLQLLLSSLHGGKHSTLHEVQQLSVHKLRHLIKRAVACCQQHSCCIAAAPTDGLCLLDFISQGVLLARQHQRGLSEQVVHQIVEGSGLGQVKDAPEYPNCPRVSCCSQDFCAQPLICLQRRSWIQLGLQGAQETERQHVSGSEALEDGTTLSQWVGMQPRPCSPSWGVISCTAMVSLAGPSC